MVVLALLSSVIAVVPMLVMAAAESEPNNDFGYAGWSGDITDSSPTTSITMDSNKKVTATFASGVVLVSIDAPDGAATDSDFTANVNISEVVDFDYCNYDISFDASVLRLDNVASRLIDSTTIPVDLYRD